MKFQPDTLDGVNAITRQEPGRLWVGRTAYAHSVLVPWVGAVQAWDATRASKRWTPQQPAAPTTCWPARAGRWWLPCCSTCLSGPPTAKREDPPAEHNIICDQAGFGSQQSEKNHP